jgi:ornithine carbamoyltransferase
MAKAKKECIYMHCLPAINGSDSNYSEFVKERLSKKFP